MNLDDGFVGGGGGVEEDIGMHLRIKPKILNGDHTLLPFARSLR